MAYTETRTVGYGSRLKNSLTGIPMGFLLFIAGTCLLFWNEGRTVKMVQTIEQAEKEYMELGDVNTINAAAEGKLTHSSGTASTDDMLTDDLFPDVSGNYMRLERKAEYYQYVEQKHEQRRDKLGGGEEIITTYTYSRKWVNEPVNSSDFHDPQYRGVNAVRATVDDNVQYAQNVKYGAYTLPEAFIKMIGSTSPAAFKGHEEEAKQAAAPVDTTDSAAMAAANPGDTATQEELAADIAAAKKMQATTPDATQSKQYTVVNGNTAYYGSDVNNPQVGDVRVTFYKVDPKCDISMLAVPQGGSFTEYVGKHGNTLYSPVVNGKKSADEMFQSERETNNLFKWILRIVGVLMVVGGLKMIFQILTTLLKVVPFLASIMNFGVSTVCWILGIAWSLIVIAVGWIFYRPLLGIGLLVVAGALIAWLVVRGKKKQATQQPQMQPAPVPQQPQMPQQQFPQQQFPQQPQMPQMPQQQFPQQPQMPQQGFDQQPPQQMPPQQQPPQQGGWSSTPQNTPDNPDMK